MKHIVLLVALAVCGCAGYSVQEGGNGVGYDVYRPEPYLRGEAVVDTSSGVVTGWKFTTLWLPNYSKRYRVRSWAGFGKADFAFKFTDGWQLIEITDKSSNDNVLSQLTDLAKHLIPANPFGMSPQPKLAVDEAAKQPVPLLYKIDIDECTGDVCLREVMKGDSTCSKASTAK